MNTKLKQSNYDPVEDVFSDLSTGVKLIQLLEVIGSTTLGRYNRQPK